MATAREKLKTALALNESEKVSINQLMAIQFHVERGRTDEEIAMETKLTLETVSLIVAQEGWRVLLVDADAQKTADQRGIARWQRAVAASSRYLALKGMELAHGAALAQDTMGFANAARGTKAFVDMATQVTDPNKGRSGGAGSINLFFYSGEVQPIRRAERNVQPISKPEIVNDISVQVVDSGDESR